MPGAGTHTTIIQRLAKLAKDNPDAAAFLKDPDLNANWACYDSADALQSRYAILGAMGPDIFYMMLDYGDSMQKFEDIALKIAGTFRAAGTLSSEINNLVNSTLDALTDGIWKDIQQVFSNLSGILTTGILDLIVDQRNFWFFFLPLRQVDDYPYNWYWADFLHYVKTGCFTQKLLDNAAAQCAAAPCSATSGCLSAYALGYLTHYVADTVGHAYVNRIVESPWRNTWQRHHLVENFIDAHVWATWHDEGTEPDRPADEQNLDQLTDTASDPARDTAARLSYSRLNDLCNIGSSGIDPIIDNAVQKVADAIQQGLFNLGLSSVPSLQPPDDPVFTTWTEFIADTMWQTYPPGQVHPSRMGRYPTSDDIAGAYGAYRLVLSLATEDDVDKPTPPDIVGDLAAILSQMWSNITSDLSSVPPPPVPASGQSFSLEALWDEVKAGLAWLGQVAEAALGVLGDLLTGLIEAGVALAADTIKAGLYLINTILYSMYHTLRMTLVMSAYSSPFNDDLTATWGPLDLRTLWNAPAGKGSPRYPVEPMVSERDFAANQANPHSPYRPYFPPSGLAPVNVEAPATVFPAQVLAWTSPDDMLDSAVEGTDDMFAADGPAPATTVPLTNHDGSPLTDLETFDGSQRYFGSIMANCEAALGFAVPYLNGVAYPEGTVLPDYNLDSDRGYAWPCWDVDWSYKNPMAPFPWNGCDPYPSDTLGRVPGSIDWGADQPSKSQVPPGLRPGLSVNDPWGSPRSGNAWINATALSQPGDCQYASFPFPAIVVNPNRGDLAEMDVCGPVQRAEGGGLLGPDYKFPVQPAYLHSDADDPDAPQDDLPGVYLNFPYQGPTTTENDGRLADFLRAMAHSTDPRLMLANAVSIWLSGPTTPVAWGDGTITSPAPIPADPDLAGALAQLAVTGRCAFGAFAEWTPQDSDLVAVYSSAFPDSTFTAAQIQDAATCVLNAAYSALWAIRSNDPSWRSARTVQPWLAVSGFDDTPHRPVNVPTAPYPQYDLSFTVPLAGLGGTLGVTTRYMIASAGTWVGPDDPDVASFTTPSAPDADILLAPPGNPITSPPRTIPRDLPSIPAGNKIIVYLHGGGSRSEEAVDMANWFIIGGYELGDNYTVISFDMPNSAFGAPFGLAKVAGTNYDHGQLDVLRFEQDYIIAFIEELDATIGGVKDQIVAVMGGSLGGNMSALLTGRYDQDHTYLRTIVSWSVTAMAPSKYLGIISGGDVAAYLAGLQADATEPEPFDNHAIETGYISDMYTQPLSGLLGIPPQPVMWYRGGYAGGIGTWQPCKNEDIARSRFDRYEIYSAFSRQWTIAIDLEQISFSFQDFTKGLSAVTTPDGPDLPGSRLMLVAGDNDNFFPNAIYNSTIDLARSIRLTGQGKAEFWLDTGHSIHNERPHLFANEILYFLANLDTSGSAYGVIVSTPPKAGWSVTTQ